MAYRTSGKSCRHLERSALWRFACVESGGEEEKAVLHGAMATKLPAQNISPPVKTGAVSSLSIVRAGSRWKPGAGVDYSRPQHGEVESCGGGSAGTISAWMSLLED